MQLKLRSVHYTRVQARWRQAEPGDPLPGKSLDLPPGVIGVFMLPGGDHLLLILEKRVALVEMTTEHETIRLNQLAELQFDPAHASDVSLSMKYYSEKIYNSKHGLIIVSLYQMG